MSATETTANETFDSLTGFDEIAIRKEFRQDVARLYEADAMAFIRAMVFVHQRRQGLKDPAAFQAAMEMPQRELQHYFADEPDGEGDGLGEAPVPA